ncbi:MAG TPA: BamA/TamA family outer membrane protein [Ignavibacteriaceae bacterium]|nr:BamA/TamA family outer membrane protein [Ignavibacteriaceae bacterium]
MQKNKFHLLFFFLIISQLLFSQSSYEKKYITIIPGKQYEAGWLHEVFFGAHWRDLWTTPVQAEILDLDKFAGGLTPLKQGGGQQTKSLQFKGKDGRIWKFRSLNKDPKKILPPELQESLVGDIIQDQISTSNPMAPFVVAPFLDSLGIMQSKPTMVILPDDEKLGEFRSEFGNLLGMIEEHPDEDSPSYESAEKVSGTFKLFETLDEKRDHRVNKNEYFKARLVDIFLGDWDRHSDQWRWARYDTGEDKTWYPIPRDRDQAFAKYDGFFPAIASYFTPQLTNFGYSYPQVEDITWNGKFVDRRFLTEIDKRSWDSVTAFVHNKLTDELIINSVKQLPPEFYEKAGEELISKLKSRRDKITEFSNDYYEFINEVVEIFCSEKDDFIEVNRLNDYETEVGIYKLEKDSGSKKDSPFYHKVFDNSLTKEFRINLGDGDDKVLIIGEVNKSPLVRIIGGGGQDEIEDNSIVHGYFLSVIPISDAENKTLMYDHGNETKINSKTGIYWDDEKIPEPKDDFEKYEPKLRDRGSDLLYKPVIGYNSFDGFILGSGLIFNSYNFRMDPLEYSMDFSAGYATNPKSYFVTFNGDFYSIIKGALVNLDFYLSELSLTNYYGYGNETDFDKDLESDDYYRLNQELLSIRPSIKFPLVKNLLAGFGLSYNYSDISLDNDTLLNNLGNNNYGVNTMKLAGISASLEFDSRDVSENTLEGFFIKLSGNHFPEVMDNKSSFTKAGFDTRAYFTNDFITDVTLALRGGGEKLFGTYPFFKAAFLGGGDNLRGYNRERFSGDASLFGQAELRFYLTDIKLIINGRFGFFGFAETGRVFVEHDNSEKWHPSYGGGLWLSYLNRTLNLNLTLANSEETLVFYFLTRFMF